MQLVISQEYNTLPKIPIYSRYSFEFPDSSPFYRTSDKNEAFYNMYIEPQNTIRGAENRVRYISYIAGAWAGYKLGQSLGKAFISESGYTTRQWSNSTNSYVEILDEERYNGAISGAGALGSYYVWLLTWGSFNTGDVGKKTKTTTYIVTLKTSGGNLVFEKKIKAKSDGKIVDINNRAFNNLFLVGWYPLSPFYVILKKTFLRGGAPSAVSFANANFNFINELYPKYSKLNSIIAKSSKSKVDYSDIVKSRDKNLALLGNPKGEFESTLQFQDRLKKEELVRREIEATYSQKMAQRKADNEMKQLKMSRKIQEMANEIEIERSYDFSLSKYNADKQEFIIYIPALKKQKKLIIPIEKAKDFKEKSEKLVVKKLLKPSLHGQWISVHDDVVLTNPSTGKIIPWEGEIPTYAVAPVTNPPYLSAEVNLSEPSGEGYLDAEELAILKVTLTNSGLGPAKTTKISVSQKSGPTLYYDVSASINSIAPGDSHTEQFQIAVPEKVKSGKVSYTISFLEAQGFEPNPINFNADVRAQREPILSLIDFGVSDQNDDGKVSKGESAEIVARIQNKGQGKAKNVRVKINPMGNEIFMHPDSKKNFTIGSIPAGEARDVAFTVLTNNRISSAAKIELKLDEKRPRFSKSVFINLEIDKQHKQLETLSFKGVSSDIVIADLATLTVEIEKDIPKGKKKNPDALAVVFGIEKYKKISDVIFAKRDATYMKEYFENTLGIPDRRIYYKTNDDVGKAEFDKVFSKDGWLDKRLKKEKTDLYIFYAGHGAPDIKRNKAYLIPYDGDPNYASQTGYEIDKLYEQLANLGARSTTIFLDACFTGANREGEILLSGSRPVFMEVDASATRNLTIFSASGGKQISSAWPEKKHGLFSYYLMKGMRGDADLDKNSSITIGELGDYIIENVSSTAGILDREQTPSLSTQNESAVFISY